MKKHLALVLCLTLLLSLIAVPAPAEEAAGKTEKTLLCLGDSIASGFALKNMEAERYSTLIAERLTRETGTAWQARNAAVPGHNSMDWLKLLQSGAVEGLAEADTVLLCIGANNVLIPMTGFLAQFAGDAFIYSLGQGGTPDPAMAAGAYQQVMQVIEKNLTQLPQDLHDGIALIREKNPHADILIMTIYNPYRYAEYTLNFGAASMDVAKMGDEMVAKINEIIRKTAAEEQLKIAGVYDAFAAWGPLLINAESGPVPIGDPHPSRWGHIVIADTFFRLMVPEQ